MDVGLMTAGTLGEALDAAFRRWPERVAVVAGDRTLTYGDLGRMVARLAGAYLDLGVRPGDRVVCQLPNCPEQLVVMGAAWSTGAVHVGASPDLSLPELLWFVDRTEASAVVVGPRPVGGDPLTFAGAVWADHPDTLVLVADDESPAAGLISLTQLIAGGGGTSLPSRPGPDDVAVIFFTSGTTGRPKGPLGFHGSLAEVWQEFGAALGCGPDDVHLAQLPMAFGFGMQMAAISLLTGGRLRLMSRFSVSEACDLIERDRITVLNGTPAHYNMLLEHLASESHDITSLRTGVGSAASFAPALLRRVLDEMGMQPLLLYGSSELLYVCTSDREDLLRGAVGRPTPGQLVIVGPDHAPRPTGQLGEIAFRVRLPVRYWKEPEASREPGEWYYTGDVGRLDAEGRLYVLGRLKHQINRGGHKIEPGEVETLLHGYPGVVDHAVIGLPDDMLGDVVCVCVVAPSDPPDLEALRTHLALGLAQYKLPDALCVVPTIPRNRNGKVDHDALLAIALSSDLLQRRTHG